MAEYPYNQPEFSGSRSDENPTLARNGASAEQRAEIEKTECFAHHIRAGTFWRYYEQYPIDRPPGYELYPDEGRGR